MTTHTKTLAELERRVSRLEGNAAVIDGMGKALHNAFTRIQEIEEKIGVKTTKSSIVEQDNKPSRDVLLTAISQLNEKVIQLQSEKKELGRLYFALQNDYARLADIIGTVRSAVTAGDKQPADEDIDCDHYEGSYGSDGEW